MTIWSMILIAGIGTFLMRSAGLWLPPSWVPTHWLRPLPLAVILVMVVASLLSLATHSTGAIAPNLVTQAAIAIASLAVILASLKQLPLYVCIVLGCGLYGAISLLAAGGV